MPHKDPEIRRAYLSRYREKHREETRARQSRWREKHREKERLRLRMYARVYRQAHPEEARARRRAYYAAHPEQERAQVRVYYAAHAEERRAKSLLYTKMHPERNRARAKRRRALKAGAGRHDFTASQWKEMQAACDHRCTYCGKRAKGHLTQDHITPLSKGGEHTMRNILPACLSCNARKNNGPLLLPVQPFLVLGLTDDPTPAPKRQYQRQERTDTWNPTIAPR